MKRLLSPLLILIFACQTLALDIPKPNGHVNDLANVLDSNQEQKLEAKFSKWEKETSNEFAVLIIDSLEGETANGYSFRVAESWGVGKADKDNGMLLLISLQDRKWWIQIGEGLEGVMPDGKAGLILDRTLPGYFKKGDFYGGIDDASRQLMRGVGAEYSAASTKSSTGSYPVQPSSSYDNAFLIFIIVFSIIIVVGIIIAVIISVNQESRGSGYSYRPSKPYIPPRSTTTYLPSTRRSSSKKKKRSSSSSSSSSIYIPTPTYSSRRRSSSSSSSYSSGSSSSSYSGGSFGGSFGGFGGGGFSGGGAGGSW